MQWDLGIEGVAVLLLMSVAVGVAAQLLWWRSTPHWLWSAVAAVYFVSGLLISEVWFGWATEEELQPNYDGLSFDEVLLIGMLPALATVLVVRRRARHRRAPARHHGHLRTR